MCEEGLRVVVAKANQHQHAAFSLTGGEEVSCSMRGGIGTEALEEVEELLCKAFAPNSL